MNDPLVTQGLSVSGIILAVKALITYSRVMGWWQLSDEQEAATIALADAFVPILAVWVGVWWARRRTTSLKEPRDVDGTPLSRPGDMPTIPQIKELQQEALKINQQIDERRIDRGNLT